jgi:hypothetical protein
MTVPSVTASDVRRALLLREEVALLDLRHEAAAYATGHPLFAANMAADRIARFMAATFAGRTNSRRRKVL